MQLFSVASLQIDDSASESFLGVIIAAFSLGLILAAPLFGLWSNYRPVLEPLIFSQILYCIGNLLYVYAEDFSNIEKWILFLGRFIVGTGTGQYFKILIICLTKLLCMYYYIFAANIVVLRSYCSAATWEDERTTVMSFLAGVRAIGFILGPGAQLISFYS